MDPDTKLAADIKFQWSFTLKNSSNSFPVSNGFTALVGNASIALVPTVILKGLFWSWA
jgi:hypothetical protein